MPIVKASVKLAKKKFGWNPQRELTLVHYVLKEKGYIRTDINLTDKFNTISRKVNTEQDFAGSQLDGAALKKKWDRISLTIDTKYSISMEGANLSGLDEEPSEIEKLVLQMLRERFETAKVKEEQKAKDTERNEKMLTHERKMLARQDKEEDMPDDELSDCSSDVTRNDNLAAKKPRKNISPVTTSTASPVFDFELEVINALKEDPRIVDIEVAERRQKLEDAHADKAHARDMEMRRAIADENVALERAKADCERSKADQLTANAQLMMMEFLKKAMNV